MRKIKIMRVPEDILNTVAFLSYLDDPQDEATEKYAGTGSVVAIVYRGMTFLYLVTAEHVAHGLDAVAEPLMRINDVRGNGYTFPLMGRGRDANEGVDHPGPRWYSHPSDSEADVAVQPLFMQRHSRFANVIPDIITLPDSYFLEATPMRLGKEIGVGDEVFVVGLFHYAAGERGNSPIVRTGNLAMIPSEKISSGATNLGKTYGYMDAYLIEARSIGGLSGSPVFVRRTVDISDFVQATDSGWWLLGIVHGHWDIHNDVSNAIMFSRSELGKGVNVGVAIVTPSYKIVETLYRDALVEQRESFVNRGV